MASIVAANSADNSADKSAAIKPVVLCIGYAHKSCTGEQVMRAFETALEDNEIVHKVEMLDKTNDNTGEPFKLFFIHFAYTNTAVQHMLSRIEADGFFVLTYGTRKDHKSGAHIETYWKVTEYKPKAKDEFKPRIMSVEEAEIAGIKRPKA
jgi:hypothetical protein